MAEIVMEGNDHLLPLGEEVICDRCSTRYITDQDDRETAQESSEEEQVWFLSCPKCKKRQKYIKETEYSRQENATVITLVLLIVIVAAAFYLGFCFGMGYGADLITW